MSHPDPTSDNEYPEDEFLASIERVAKTEVERLEKEGYDTSDHWRDREDPLPENK